MPRNASSVGWILACAAAETVGMTVAAGAARMADGVLTRSDSAAGSAAALVVIVAAGVVEGLALGSAQGGQLRQRLPGLPLKRFVLVTLMVAGVGWAVASAPATLGAGGDATGTTPPLALVLVGAAGIGVVMGGVLGGCQALVLRTAAARPSRWLFANLIAWPPAMVVIFLGASTASATWPVGTLVGYGGLTGAAAGTVLGLLTAPFLPRPADTRDRPRRRARHRLGVDARVSAT